MIRAATAALLAAMLSIPATAGAQSPIPVPGLRVRVDASPVMKRRVIGTIMSRTNDTLAIASSATVWHRIAVADVRHIDVSGGNSHFAGTMLGIIGGGLAIGGLTAVLTVSSAKDPGWLITAFGGGGAALGAVIGATIGIERWTRVAPPRPPVERTRPGLVR
jgi:hypothetical protein